MALKSARTRRTLPLRCIHNRNAPCEVLYPMSVMLVKSFLRLSAAEGATDVARASRQLWGGHAAPRLEFAHFAAQPANGVQQRELPPLSCPACPVVMSLGKAIAGATALHGRTFGPRDKASLM